MQEDTPNEKYTEVISEEEKVLWKGRRNDSILNFYLIAGLVITVIIAVFFFSQGSVEHQLGRNNLTSGQSIAGLTVLIGFVVSFTLYYNKLASRYVITDKKVIVQYGLVTETVQYAYHENIRHMHIKQGIIGALFNVGTVYVDSGKMVSKEMHFREVRGMLMDPKKPKIVYYALKNVQNPQKIYNLIERMIQKSKEPKPHESINEKIKEAEKTDEEKKP